MDELVEAFDPWRNGLDVWIGRSVWACAREAEWLDITSTVRETRMLSATAMGETCTHWATYPVQRPRQLFGQTLWTSLGPNFWLERNAYSRDSGSMARWERRGSRVDIETELSGFGQSRTQQTTIRPKSWEGRKKFKGETRIPKEKEKKKSVKFNKRKSGIQSTHSTRV